MALSFAQHTSVKSNALIFYFLIQAFCRVDFPVYASLGCRSRAGAAPAAAAPACAGLEAAAVAGTTRPARAGRWVCGPRTRHSCSEGR